jgi:Beta-lactamase enzyme family
MRQPSFLGVLAAVVILSCMGCSMTASAASTAAVKTRSAVSPSARPRPRPKASGSGQATAAAGLTARAVQKDLSTAVAPVIGADGGHAAVAVDDLTTGQDASYDGGSEFVTASIVKVDILATLLCQLQQAGQTLSDEQQELATTMIENSDNDAASALYDDDGEAAGVDAANSAFGLTQTTAGSSGAWGLTSTTAADQIKILRQVFTTGSLLSPASRDYIQDLLSEVEPDQRWGVSAAADSGRYLVKNGWLPNPTLWEINSIGEVIHDGQTMLIAVLSDDNQTEDGGIDLVQQIAQEAAGAMSS